MPIRVYIIDDESMLRAAFRSLLDQRDEFQVVGTSGDARVALEELADTRPDVVLLDVTMPNITGLDAIPLIQKATPRTRIVMLTSHEAESFVRQALQSGAGNVKDRLKIQLEPEKSGAANHLRRGQVVFDGWTMSAKLKDLPTIIESQKTIDRKTFYKTADICQILVCKEGDQEDSDEGEAASPNKKVISCVAARLIKSLSL